MKVRVRIELYDDKGEKIEVRESTCANDLEVARYLRRLSDTYRRTFDAKISQFEEHAATKEIK